MDKQNQQPEQTIKKIEILDLSKTDPTTLVIGKKQNKSFITYQVGDKPLHLSTGFLKSADIDIKFINGEKFKRKNQLKLKIPFHLLSDKFHQFHKSMTTGFAPLTTGSAPLLATHADYTTDSDKYILNIKFDGIYDISNKIGILKNKKRTTIKATPLQLKKLLTGSEFDIRFIYRNFTKGIHLVVKSITIKYNSELDWHPALAPPTVTTYLPTGTDKICVYKSTNRIMDSNNKIMESLLSTS
jgi:hypothetical protein